MVTLKALLDYTNSLLSIDRFADYCPNGLQVEGSRNVTRLVSGVTASMELIEAAIDAQADAIVVHHGYFWKGEDACVTGMKRARLQRLLGTDTSLLAYHLPLDAHPQLGNNAQLAERLGFQPRGCFGNDAGLSLAQYGTLSATRDGAGAGRADRRTSWQGTTACAWPVGIDSNRGLVYGGGTVLYRCRG